MIKEYTGEDFFYLSTVGVQLCLIKMLAENIEMQESKENGDIELDERLARYFWVPEFSDNFRKKCGNGGDSGLRRDLLEKLEGQNDQQIADIILQELGYYSVDDFLKKNRAKILPVVHMRAIVGEPSKWVHGAVTRCYNRSSKH